MISRHIFVECHLIEVRVLMNPHSYRIDRDYVINAKIWAT